MKDPSEGGVKNIIGCTKPPGSTPTMLEKPASMFNRNAGIQCTGTVHQRFSWCDNEWGCGKVHDPVAPGGAVLKLKKIAPGRIASNACCES